MVPANQGLKTSESNAFQIDDRLIVDLKFVAADRKSQICFQLEQRYRSRMHLPVKYHDALSFFLCMIHRDICVTYYLLGLCIVRRAKCDTDTDTRKNPAIAKPEGLRQPLSHANGK